MIPLKYNTASQYVYVRLFDATDHVTPETGITSPTITASKNAGLFAVLHDGAWSEPLDGNGIYTIRLDATDTNTVGPLVIRVVKSGCEDAYLYCIVSTYTVDDVYSSVSDLHTDIGDVHTDVGDLHTDLGDVHTDVGTLQTDVTTIKGYTDDIGVAGAGLTALGDTRLANLDATVSSRLASGSYTAPDNTGIDAAEAVAAKLENMIEADGGDWRYKANALEETPTGASTCAWANWFTGTHINVHVHWRLGQWHIEYIP